MISLQKIEPLRERVTKRLHICQSLQKQIAAQKIPSGSPFPTTQTLARHFGVSFATIQAAMDDLVLDGWLVRHQGKGTFTADRGNGAKRPLSSSLVAVLPVQEDIAAVGASTEMLQLLHGNAAGASECGAHMEVLSLPSIPGPREIDANLPTLLANDGAIFFGKQYAPLIEELRRREKPLAIVDGDPALGANVWYDRKGATHAALDHLIEHGYRRIAYFGATEENGSTSKYAFFRQALERHGIAIDAALVQDCPIQGDAYQVADRLLGQSPLPEAVFVDNYHKAVVLVQLAQSRGLRVPGDFAVMAYGTETPGTAQPLSHMAVPYTEMGRAASLVLDQLIRGRVKPPVERILRARLILGESCGCKPPGGDIYFSDLEAHEATQSNGAN